MSRAGYCDDGLDPLAHGRWRAQVNSALRGKRGQKFLRDLLHALEALPEKRLIKNDLESADGVCALGALGRYRGVSMESLDTSDWEALGSMFDIAEQLAREVMYINDERYPFGASTPEARWQSVHDWATWKLRPAEIER